MISDPFGKIVNAAVILIQEKTDNFTITLKEQDKYYKMEIEIRIEPTFEEGDDEPTNEFDKNGQQESVNF